MKRYQYPAQELIPRSFEVFQAIATGSLIQTYLRPSGPAIQTPQGPQQTLILDADAMRRDCVVIAKALMDECIHQSDKQLTYDGRVYWKESDHENE
jgi:hypothetical protein